MYDQNISLRPGETAGLLRNTDQQFESELVYIRRQDTEVPEPSNYGGMTIHKTLYDSYFILRPRYTIKCQST